MRRKFDKRAAGLTYTPCPLCHRDMVLLGGIGFVCACGVSILMTRFEELKDDPEKLKKICKRNLEINSMIHRKPKKKRKRRRRNRN